MRSIIVIIFLHFCITAMAQTAIDTSSEVAKMAKSGNTEDAIELLELSYVNNENNGFRRSNIEISLGRIYYTIGNTKKAILIAHKALTNAKKGGLFTVEVNAYNLLGNCANFDKNHDLALDYYMKADSINSATKKNTSRGNRAKVNILTARKNLGHEISKAELAEMQELKESTTLVILWNHLELLLIRTDDLSVEEFKRRHEKITRRVNPTANLYTRRAVIEIEKEFYERKKLYDRVPSIDAKLAAFNDEHLKDVNKVSFDEVDAKYVKEQQDREIQYLDEKNKAQQKIVSQQRWLLIIGSSALLLITFLSYFLFRLNKRTEKQKQLISKTLKEKDILLREIHHRVKNNLQLVSSLLTMQGRSIDDIKALEAINDGKSRVRSMALIHQDLYNKENLMGIGVKQYIEKLTTELFTTYRINQDLIDLEMDIDEIELDVDVMVPLGLIINELITNSLKYAFPDGNKGVLKVSLKEKENKLKLVVGDNGIGYEIKDVKQESFGTTLIFALTEQLEGEIKTYSDNGTTTVIHFSDYDQLS